MKVSLTSILFVLAMISGLVVRAEVSDLVPVQGILIDASGASVNGKFTMTFSIYDEEDNHLWSEKRASQQRVDVANGHFALYLGELNSLPFEALRAAEQLWLVLKTGQNEHQATRYRIPAGLLSLETNRGEQLGALLPGQIQPAMKNACDEGEYLNGWRTTSDSPSCVQLKNIAGSGSFQHLEDVPTWMETEDIDTVYDVGTGLQMLGGSILQLAFVDVEAWVSSVCYDDFTELDFLDFSSAGHSHTLDSLTTVPSGLVDATDNDTQYSGGRGLEIEGNRLRARGSPFANLVIVAKDGGDFTNIQEAIDSVMTFTPGAENPVLVLVYPGTYQGAVVVEPHVHLRGFGPRVTVISSSSPNTLVLRGNTSLKDLSVSNFGDAEVNNAMYAEFESGTSVVSNAAFHLDHFCGEACESSSVHIHGAGTSIELKNIIATGNRTGLTILDGANVTIRGGYFEGVTNSNATLNAESIEVEGLFQNLAGGVCKLWGGSTINGEMRNGLSNSTIVASQTHFAEQIVMLSGSVANLNRSVVAGSVENGGGMFTSNDSIINSINISAGTAALRRGYAGDVSLDDPSATVEMNNVIAESMEILETGGNAYIHNSTISNTSVPIQAEYGNVEISHSTLLGGDIVGASTCLAVVHGTTFYQTTCP